VLQSASRNCLPWEECTSLPGAIRHLRSGRDGDDKFKNTEVNQFGGKSLFAHGLVTPLDAGRVVKDDGRFSAAECQKN